MARAWWVSQLVSEIHGGTSTFASEKELVKGLIFVGFPFLTSSPLFWISGQQLPSGPSLTFPFICGSPPGFYSRSHCVNIKSCGLALWTPSDFPNNPFSSWRLSLHLQPIFGLWDEVKMAAWSHSRHLALAHLDSPLRMAPIEAARVMTSWRQYSSLEPPSRWTTISPLCPPGNRRFPLLGDNRNIIITPDLRTCVPRRTWPIRRTWTVWTVWMAWMAWTAWTAIWLQDMLRNNSLHGIHHMVICKCHLVHSTLLTDQWLYLPIHTRNPSWRQTPSLLIPYPCNPEPLHRFSRICLLLFKPPCSLRYKKIPFSHLSHNIIPFPRHSLGNRIPSIMKKPLSLLR